MKKIFVTILFAVLALNSRPVLAKDSVKTEDKVTPSITIEFHGMEELSNEFKNIDKDSSDNKVEINYEDSGGLSGFLALGVFLILFIVFIVFASIIFWILMLIHAITKPIKTKAVWILILLLFGIIGAIIYYFTVKREFVKKDKTIKAEKVDNS